MPGRDRQEILLTEYIHTISDTFEATSNSLAPNTSIVLICGDILRHKSVGLNGSKWIGKNCYYRVANMPNKNWKIEALCYLGVKQKPKNTQDIFIPRPIKQ